MQTKQVRLYLSVLIVILTVAVTFLYYFLRPDLNEVVMTGILIVIAIAALVVFVATKGK